MARRYTRGTSVLGHEVDEKLHNQIRRYARQRGETVRVVIERAFRREMASPPPVPKRPADPPLPVPG